jgi:hypothetical protein
MRTYNELGCLLPMFLVALILACLVALAAPKVDVCPICGHAASGHVICSYPGCGQPLCLAAPHQHPKPDIQW